MKKRKKLFDLIKSLNRTEKRHFSKYTKKYSVSSDLAYINLYKVLDKMLDFDKNSLIKKVGFSNYTFTYLYDQILFSLRVFYRQDSYYQILLNNIFDINLLMKKSFLNKLNI